GPTRRIDPAVPSPATHPEAGAVAARRPPAVGHRHRGSPPLNAYLDSSALVKIARAEPGHDVVKLLLDEVAQSASSVVAYAEPRAACGRAERASRGPHSKRPAPSAHASRRSTPRARRQCAGSRAWPNVARRA